MYNVTSRIKMAFWTFVHDVVAHPFCGLAWMVNTSTTNRFGYWLHDITLPALWVQDEKGIRTNA